MRPPRLALIASLTFLLVVSTASLANAASLTFERFFQELEQKKSDGDYIDFIFFNSPLSTTDVVTGLVNSISFTDSTVNASFNVDMTGVGSFTDALVLGSSIAVSGTSASSGDYYANAAGVSQMIFKDTLTLSGASGSGTLRLGFDVDGTLSDGGSAAILASNLTNPVSNQGGQLLTSGQQHVVLDVGFLWGQTWLMSLQLASSVEFDLSPGDTTGGGSALFANTATLSSVSVLDGNGQLVPGARILSGTDLTYPSGNPATPIPEPSSLSLIALGIAGAAARRRRLKASA